MAEKQEFSKYERARILGARALQISMDAPLLIKTEKEELEKINYDPLKIAQMELDSNVLPIAISKPLPLKKEDKLRGLKAEEIEKEDEDRRDSEEEKEHSEIVHEERAMEEKGMKSDEETEEEVEEAGIADEVEESSEGEDSGGFDNE
jgi:DNA-directed RNA polymerase subunit K/omega